MPWEPRGSVSPRGFFSMFDKGATGMERMDRRGDAQPRPLTLIPNFVETADGSCLITAGKTRVICTASVEEGVPPFLRGEGRGWVTAEYAMLPASTGRRKARDGIKKDGRGVEIQRLIGRSLRQAVEDPANKCVLVDFWA